MKIRIKRFAPLQTGKMLAVIYALFGVVIVPFMLVAVFIGPKGNGGLPIVAVLLFPLMYIVGGFVGGVIGAFVYNLVAGWIGGLEIDFEEEKEDQPPILDYYFVAESPGGRFIGTHTRQQIAQMREGGSLSGSYVVTEAIGTFADLGKAGAAVTWKSVDELLDEKKA